MIAGLRRLRAGAKLRSVRRMSGSDYLLPALVGAFLARPRSSPAGQRLGPRYFGVLISLSAISGIQQLGGAFFVEPLFNGTTLVISIALEPSRSAGAPSLDQLVSCKIQARSK